MTKKLIPVFALILLIALSLSPAFADSHIISKDGKKVGIELHCGSIIEAIELDQNKQIELESSILAQKCRMAVIGSRQGFVKLNDNAIYHVKDSVLVRTE